MSDEHDVARAGAGTDRDYDDGPCTHASANPAVMLGRVIFSIYIARHIATTPRNLRHRTETRMTYPHAATFSNEIRDATLHGAGFL